MTRKRARRGEFYSNCLLKKMRAARAKDADCQSRETPARMQSSRHFAARGAAGTRMSTRGGRRYR